MEWAQGPYLEVVCPAWLFAAGFREDYEGTVRGLFPTMAQGKPITLLDGSCQIPFNSVDEAKAAWDKVKGQDDFTHCAVR